MLHRTWLVHCAEGVAQSFGDRGEGGVCGSSLKARPNLSTLSHSGAYRDGRRMVDEPEIPAASCVPASWPVFGQ
jgi:hypothetical protein